MPKPVLIDTDAGVDDALALIFALRSPELSVKAITSVAGNVEVQKCTRNVHRILDLIQPNERPVVAEGAEKPLQRSLVTAPEVHGRDGLGDVRLAAPNLSRTRSAPARDVIIQCCREFGQRLTIIALGPLTNLALAWRKAPSAVRRIGRIVTMGGAFRVPGNTGPMAEFNYYVDPEAAQLILTSGLPVTVIPLDVTQQAVLMRCEVEYRAGRRASPVALAIARFTKKYMRYHRIKDGFEGGYLHDPVAVAAAIDRSLFVAKRARVEVETHGRITRGVTVADFRRAPAPGRASVDVALRIERERFLKLFHERLWK